MMDMELALERREASGDETKPRRRRAVWPPIVPRDASPDWATSRCGSDEQTGTVPRRRPERHIATGIYLHGVICPPYTNASSFTR